MHDESDTYQFHERKGSNKFGITGATTSFYLLFLRRGSTRRKIERRKSQAGDWGFYLSINFCLAAPIMLVPLAACGEHHNISGYKACSFALMTPIAHPSPNTSDRSDNKSFSFPLLRNHETLRSIAHLRTGAHFRPSVNEASTAKHHVWNW